MRILEPAGADFDDAYGYYFSIDPELADNLAIEFRAALARIDEAPLLWGLLDRRHRFCRLKRFPFRIVYRIESAEVVVVAFAHKKRRPRYWRNR